MRSCFLAASLLLFGCPHRIADPDAGALEDDGGQPSGDAGDGNDFEGTVVVDDGRVLATDPSMLRQGDSPCREPVLVRVYRITDGDTIDVRGEDVVLDVPVRMIGVDTPEIAHQPGDPTDCYGDEATTFTSQLQGRLLWLSFDEECFDRYNRLLAYVHIGPSDGDMWQRQLLRRGFATEFHVAPNTQFQSMFEADEAAASADNAGLWAACR